MTRSYKLMPLDLVVAGMELSDDILDRYGKVLLPKGCILTEKLLASLHRYEIEAVPVISDELPPEDRLMRQAYHQERLGALFRKHDYGAPDDNANDILQQHVLHFRLGEKS